MTRDEKTKKVFSELFGDLPSDEKDPEFGEILRKFIFGDVFDTGSLDNKTREMITVTILATLQTLPQLKAHLYTLIKVGASHLEAREVMYNLAPYIGFPRTLNAIGVLNDVFELLDIEVPLENTGTVSDDDRFQKGLNIQKELYGDEMAAKYDFIPEVPQFLTEFGFGDFYTRNGLDVKTRELLNLVILIVLDKKELFKSHIKANFKVGNSSDVLYDTVIQCIPYAGFPACFTVIDMIREVDNDE